MKKRTINDMDYYAISKYLKENNKKELIGLQELMIEKWGNEECLLYSDLAKFKECKNKEPIKFPFVKK